MANKVQPFPVVLFGSVVALILSVVAYRYFGEYAFVGTACLFNALLGLIVSLRWPINPWRIGVIAVIPSIVFLVWRWISYKSPEDVALNMTLFIFLPIISLAAGYFGGFLGRSLVVRRMKRSAQASK